jgi:hypothetical protein
MDFKNILLIVVVIIVLYFVYLTLFQDKTTHQLFSAHNAKSYASFKASDLPGGGLSSDYTYSFWIYVSNYNYRFGADKPIIIRSKDATAATFPYIGLAGPTNNLEVKISSQGSTASQATEEILILDDIPLQKWTHIVVTTTGRTVDIYLDGKLVKTSVLPNMPFTVGIEDAPIHICPESKESLGAGSQTGFAGHMTKLEYFDRSLNPREVYERYKAGFGEGGAAGEMMSKFNLKIAFLQDDKEVSGLTI